MSYSVLLVDLYFGLFLLIPFLNRMYTTLNSKKEKQTLIFILSILSCFVSLLNGRFIPQFHLPTYWTCIYPLVYFFVGKYIKEFQPKIKVSLNIIYLIIIVLIQGFAEYFMAKGGLYKHFFTDYSSTLRLIEGYLIFVLFYRIDIKNEFIKKCVTRVSNLTLDIYLASFVTDRLVYKEILNPNNFTQEKYFYVMIPLIMFSFGLAFIIANIRKTLIKLR